MTYTAGEYHTTAATPPQSAPTDLSGVLGGGQHKAPGGGVVGHVEVEDLLAHHLRRCAPYKKIREDMVEIYW